MWPQAPTPIAWGWIQGNGEPGNVTPNVSSRWVDFYYEVTIDKVRMTVDHLTFITVRGRIFTPRSDDAPAWPSIGVLDNARLSIEFRDIDEARRDVYQPVGGFNFMIYPPAHGAK